jgi:nicotinamidase-related amidase
MPSPKSLDSHTEPHFGRSALLIIDTQHDFLDGGASPIPGTSQQIPHLGELAHAYRDAGLPIVHVIRMYEGDDIDLVRKSALMHRGRIVRAGSPGADIPAELLPDPAPQLDPDQLLTGSLQRIGPGEVVMWKPRWSAFHRTPLEQHLSVLGVDTVVIAGCNFPNCPRATIFDASARDLRIAIVVDAVSQITTERLQDAEAVGAHAVATAEVVNAVAART